MKTDHEETDLQVHWWAILKAFHEWAVRREVHEWATRKGVNAQMRKHMAEWLSGAVADGCEQRYLTRGCVDLDRLHRAALKSFNKPAAKRRAKRA